MEKWKIVSQLFMASSDTTLEDGFLTEQDARSASSKHSSGDVYETILVKSYEDESVMNIGKIKIF